MNAVLSPMDLIVQMGTTTSDFDNRHVMIFIEQSDGKIYFYHCTTHYGDNGVQNRTDKGSLDKTAFDRMGTRITFHNMFDCDYETEYNSGSHWGKCTLCGATTPSEAHNLITHQTTSTSTHVLHCTSCPYMTTVPHNMEYHVINATYHTHKCGRGACIYSGICRYVKPQAILQ